MPSFTFVSTANAFALRGARPVFVDIRPDTWNIDETLHRSGDHAADPGDLSSCTTPGVACEMDEIMAIAERHGLAVIEDAAHALGRHVPGPAARLDRRPRDAVVPRDEERAVRRGRRPARQRPGRSPSGPRSCARRAPTAASSSAVRSTSTPGSTIGSSYLPSELLAAFLTAQLEAFDEIQTSRMAVWRSYADSLGDWAGEAVRLQAVPTDREQPAHLFAMVFADTE